MTLKANLKIEGLKELDAALSDLVASTSSSTGKGVLRRSLVEAAEPVAEAARRHAGASRRTGRLQASIIVSGRLKNSAGKAAYAAVKRQGGSTADAVAAMREAQRADGKSTITVYVGPGGGVPYAHLVEFGTVHSAAKAYMRPAWDETKLGVLDGLKISIGKHIEASAKRAARRIAKSSGQFDTRSSKG